MNPERRIVRETQDLMKDPVPGIVVKTDPQNLRYFTIQMEGPPDSPYSGGIFELELFLPKEYPMVPPQVRFITRMYHPNVDKLGRICLDVLKERWTPALQIRAVLLSIQALLASPNPNSPLNNEVAEMWRENEQRAKDIAKQWTQQYANQKKPTIPGSDQPRGTQNPESAGSESPASRPPSGKSPKTSE